MTVDNLIKKLMEYPKEMEVVLRLEDEEFEIYPVESLKTIKVTWSEGNGTKPPEGDVWPDEDCLIISHD